MSDSSSPCRFVHATRQAWLPSIKEHGLLTAEQLRALGKRQRYPNITRPGSVYLTEVPAIKESDYFGTWTDDWDGYECLLCVDPVPAAEIIPDRNFGENTAYREHRSPVPPTHIRIHDPKHGCKPLVEGQMALFVA